MQRLMACLVIASVVGTTLCGCGGTVSVAACFNCESDTVSGVVSGVQVTTVPGSNGTPITVTVVTFEQTLGFTTQTFCGNFSTEFPKNSFARVSFLPGQRCSTILAISIT